MLIRRWSWESPRSQSARYIMLQTTEGNRSGVRLIITPDGYADQQAVVHGAKLDEIISTTAALSRRNW
jgi:hypothetical protein